MDGKARRDNAAYGCKCPAKAVPSCSDCSFYAGGFGDTCIRCKDSQYLYNGECRSSCLGTGLAEYMPGKYGGECRAPFTCSDQIDQITGGTSCKCPKAVGGSECRTCKMTLGGPKCTQCRGNKYLDPIAGTCAFRCPLGTFKFILPDGQRICAVDELSASRIAMGGAE